MLTADTLILNNNNSTKVLDKKTTIVSITAFKSIMYVYFYTREITSENDKKRVILGSEGTLAEILNNYIFVILYRHFPFRLT